jgi:ubiquitin carboxyl-terminal hydrolase 5/13
MKVLFYSSAIRAKTSAHKRTFMKTFPDFLFINLRKFIVSPNWTPAKLDVSIDVPDEMDLGMLRGRGQQPGEQLLPDESAAPTPVEYNAAAMAGLLVMGFSENSCKRALFHTQNAGLEQAKDWLMSHLDDADLHTEFVPPGAAGGGGARQQAQAEVSEENIMMMQTLGFSRQMAVKALRQTNNSLERASDRAFSHMDELDAPDAPAAPTKNVRDGSSRYRLVGFISHMGTSCQVGHYVCHLKRDNRWVIYNDEKVAFSKRPPTDLAYIYLYQRC